MIKLIASDIDGTLITGHRPMSETNKKAIYKAVEKGVIFTIVSGRGIDDILPVMENIPCHVISGNGAQYYDEHKNLLLSCYMDKNECCHVSHIMQEVGLMHMIYTTKGTITPMPVEAVRTAFVNRALAIETGDFERLYARYMEEYKPFIELKQVDDVSAYIKDTKVIKVEGFEVGDRMIKMTKDKLSNREKIYVSSSFFNNIEVMDHRATKGNILKKAIQLLNIDLEEVMVIGDGLNDISLFEMFDHTVAVDNAIAPIKKLAKYHVPSAACHGVAKAIEKYVL